MVTIGEVYDALNDRAAIIEHIRSYAHDPVVSDSCGCILHDYLCDTFEADEATVGLHGAELVFLTSAEGAEIVVVEFDQYEDFPSVVQARWMEAGYKGVTDEGYGEIFIPVKTAIAIVKGMPDENDHADARL